MSCNKYRNMNFPKSILKMGECDNPVVYADYCEEHLPYLERRQRDYEATPIEKRQEYLDLLHSGKTIGEAHEAAGISFEVALEITNHAIGRFLYLEKTAT